MIDINDLRVHESACLPNLDAAYTLHYDETNNIRRLLVTPDGLNVRAPQCFVLGGIAHHGVPPSLDFEEIRSAFQLQKSVQELKLKHLGKGDFPTLINSRKVETLLEWLSNQDLFVHFHVLDPLYWSIVDIVDSIVSEEGSVQLMTIANDLKSDLYAILRHDVGVTADLFSRYNYPEVGSGRRTAFIADLSNLLEAHRRLLPTFNYQMLKGFLQIAAKLDRLPYLEDELPDVLINCFGNFYLGRVALFKNARHFFDIELTIETYLRELDLRDGVTPIEGISFVDSKDYPWVQVSDATIGLLGKFFSFINQTSIADLKEAKSAFTDRQKKCMEILASLIGRSIEECPAFAHYVVSLEDHRRRIFVLGF